jgi:hypothetical protein
MNNSGMEFALLLILFGNQSVNSFIHKKMPNFKN